jgi:uncharacterized RDD family membrane protein YckC
MEVGVWPPELRVVLPEGLELRIRRAGLASRALAWAIDGALVLAATELVAIVTFGVGRLSSPLERAVLVAAGFVLHWAYGTLAEWRWGTTPGKRLLGLGVVDERGGRPSLRRTFARNLLRTVDVLPGLWLVGGAAAWLSREGLRLGDRAAKTYVVCLAPGAVRVQGATSRARAAQAMGPWARLGAELSEAEAVALSALCAERERLSIGTRDALFEQLGRHMAARHGVDRPAHRTWESLLSELDVASRTDRTS